MTRKERVALSSIGASLALTLGKAVIGALTGSLAILSEAGHSAIDLAATVMTFFAVRIADKPADREHHYGHGKMESFAALIETAMLFILSGIVIWGSVGRLITGGHAVEATPAAFAVIAISLLIDFFRARALARVAAETSSQALAADALHFSSDLWASLAVLVGLSGVRLGYGWADAAAALAVAIIVCLAGWRLGRRTLDTLVDAAPAGVADRITAIAGKVTNVASVDRVRAREVGATVFGEVEVGASRTLPLDRVEALKEDIEKAVKSALPNADIGVIVTPRALDDESVMERVMVIARNRGLAIHHVTVHAIAQKLSISLDLELDGSLGFRAAHDIAEKLEAAIRQEFGVPVEVETHIEPLQAHGSAGRDAPAARIAEVERALVELAATTGALRHVHDVRVRDTADGTIVNFHCDVDGTRSVAQVHELVDGLERALRRRMPAIARAIGHAEPQA
jgi:cation diffusion facilitator family transporter